MAGESVVVSASPGSKTWHAVDYEGKTVAQGNVENGSAKLGQVPVGYYEVLTEGGGGTQPRGISVGVVETLHAPTPLDSPVGIDVAMAWCFPPDKWPGATSLCQLAGMNRVRDRVFWGEMEPQRGQFSATNRNDLSVQFQTDAGLQVLDVSHVSPSWANPDGRRFPLDLRDAYRGYRELALRWRGKIVAFEPWNEADLPDFGGHTGDEMASLQKAAYLGLKAGNPSLTVCENVFGIHRQTTLHNFDDNKAWPYFDTFNLHHYEPLASYPKLYADFRAVSAGRPMWVTECSWTVKWSGDEQLKEPDAENTRIQSERLVKTYAESIHEGSKAVFFFMLPHYTERQIQYGLLHPDLTPRPGYLSLAAVGRFLAGAKPLGQVHDRDRSFNGYVFSAKPDGVDADVLVVWSEEATDLKLSQPPQARFDHLGRPLPVTGKSLELTHAPQFVVLAKGSCPVLIPPPKTPAVLPGKPGAIVLQAILPEDKIELIRSGYKMAAGRTNSVAVFLYNFGDTTAKGRFQVTAPGDWTADLPQEVELSPGDRKELTLLLATTNSWKMAARVGIQGDFGAAGEPVLALRFFDTAGKNSNLRGTQALKKPASATASSPTGTAGKLNLNPSPAKPGSRSGCRSTVSNNRGLPN